MNRFHSQAFALFLVGVCCPVWSSAQESPRFRTDISLINTTLLVRSTDSSLTKDLKKDDFEVLEDGVPQNVQFFARERELPLSLALIIDVSGSQAKFFKQHNRDVEQFLKIVLGPADKAVAVCFGNHLKLASDATSSVDDVMDGLRTFAKRAKQLPEIGPKENRELGTALYDALYYTTSEKLKQAQERRKAIVLFSDGEENSSEHDLLDVVEEAQNEDTIVYCIRYTHASHDKLNARNKYGIRVMKHLARLSGGRDFDALESNLSEVFAQIGEELHSLYSIGYISTNPNHDGSFRKLTIQCKRPGASVRAKSGYYAKE